MVKSLLSLILLAVPCLQADILYDYSDWRGARVIFSTDALLTQPTTIPSSSFLYGSPSFVINSFTIDPNGTLLYLSLPFGSDQIDCPFTTLSPGSYNCFGFWFLDITAYSAFRYEYSDVFGRELSFTTPTLLTSLTGITQFDSLSGPPSLIAGLTFLINPQTGGLSLFYAIGSDGLGGFFPNFLKAGEYQDPLYTLRITALDEVPEPSSVVLASLGLAGLVLATRRKVR